MASTPRFPNHAGLAFSGLRPVVRPPARPPASGAGAALVAPGAAAPLSAPPSGVASAGTAIKGAGRYLSSPPGSPAGTPPGTHAVTSVPPLANMTGDAWMAQLSPDQLAALGNAQATYTQNVGDANQRIADANAGYANANAQSQFAHDVNQERANEEMAARGMFVSGIRDSDLTDIQRTLTEAQTNAKATLDTLVGEATRAITALNSGWGATLGGFQGDAAANAAAAQAANTVTTYAPNAAAPTPAAAPAPAQASTPTIMQQAAAGHPNWFPGGGGRAAARGGAGRGGGGAGRGGSRISAAAQRTYGRL